MVVELEPLKVIFTIALAPLDRKKVQFAVTLIKDHFLFVIVSGKCYSYPHALLIIEHEFIVKVHVCNGRNDVNILLANEYFKFEVSVYDGDDDEDEGGGGAEEGFNGIFSLRQPHAIALSEHVLIFDRVKAPREKFVLAFTVLEITFFH